MKKLREKFIVTSLAMDIEKDLLAVGCCSQNKINFWSLHYQKRIQSFEFESAFNPINSILFFEDKIGFISNASSKVLILSGRKFDQIRSFDKGFNREIVSLDYYSEKLLIACKRPLLQVMDADNIKDNQDLFIVDTQTWETTQTINSKHLIYDAKIYKNFIYTIGINDKNGLFCLTSFDINTKETESIILGNDVDTCQIRISNDGKTIAVIANTSDDQNGDVVSTLYIIDKDTNDITYKDSQKSGNEYLNLCITKNNHLVLNFYDHSQKSSFLIQMGLDASIIQKNKINGSTNIAIATDQNTIVCSNSFDINFYELNPG